MSANAGVTSKFPLDHPLMSPARNLQLLNFREEVLRNAAPSSQSVQWLNERMGCVDADQRLEDEQHLAGERSPVTELAWRFDMRSMPAMPELEKRR